MKELYSTPLPPTLHCAPSEPKAENRGGHCCRLHHTTVKALGGWLTVGLFPRLQVSAVVWKVSFNVQSLRWETPSAFHFPGKGSSLWFISAAAFLECWPCNIFFFLWSSLINSESCRPQPWDPVCAPGLSGFGKLIPCFPLLKLFATSWPICFSRGFT